MADFDRPLSPRGYADAPIMALELQKYVKNIDFCLVSGAKRTLETASFFEKTFEFKDKSVNSNLYHAWVEDILELVKTIDNAHNSALFFGHNPGFTYLYNHFAKRSIDNLPTCGVFELVIDSGQWKAIDKSNTHAGLLTYPKLIQND